MHRPGKSNYMKVYHFKSFLEKRKKEVFNVINCHSLNSSFGCLYFYVLQSFIELGHSTTVFTITYCTASGPGIQREK
jgi:hypothetical protein